jgi:glucose/arabinose dehydrogenase
MPTRSPLIAAIPFRSWAADALAQPVVDGPPDRPDMQPAFPNRPKRPSGISLRRRPRPDRRTGWNTPGPSRSCPIGAGFLVTERPGRLRHITRDGAVSAPISGVPEVFDTSPRAAFSTSHSPPISRKAA